MQWFHIGIFPHFTLAYERVSVFVSYTAQAYFMAKSALIGGRVQQPIVVNVNNPTNPTSEQNVDSTASSYASKDNLLDEH